MISFANSWLLLLLLLVPPVTWLLHTPRRKSTLHFSDLSPFDGLPRSPWLALRWLPPTLTALALTLLVLAAARPRRGIAESRARTEGVDIVLLVDTSTSMNADDLSTRTQRLTRLDAAKKVISRFVRDRTDDRIGLVAFAAMPYTLAPLTTDHEWLLRQMDRLQTGMLEDGTAIGDAIASGVNRLRDSEAKSKVIVLLTDGIHNAGQLAPRDAAQAAAALGIKVYCVGAASDQPARGFFGLAIPGAEIDEDTLRSVATATDAAYFRATDLDSLESTYEKIDAMEKTEIELDSYTRHEEIFAIPALLALLLLAAEQALSTLTRLGRLP